MLILSLQFYEAVKSSAKLRKNVIVGAIHDDFFSTKHKKNQDI